MQGPYKGPLRRLPLLLGVCVCVCGVTECPVTNLFFVNRGTIHLLCAMVQRSGHSKCGYRG